MEEDMDVVAHFKGQLPELYEVEAVLNLPVLQPVFPLEQDKTQD